MFDCHFVDPGSIPEIFENLACIFNRAGWAWKSDVALVRQGSRDLLPNGWWVDSL